MARRWWIGVSVCARAGGAFVRLTVAPGRRRQGIGSALLDRVVERARELEVRALGSSYATPAGAAFASHAGAVEEHRIVRSLLSLRTGVLPEPHIAEGFRLVTWLGRVPDQHLAAYVEARAAMDDAPWPAGLDAPGSTAATVRASEKSLQQRDREMRLTVAMDERDAIAAFTELRVTRGSTLAVTDDTATVALRRGIGLGRAVKLESLRQLHANHPEVEAVSTENAEENIVMRHLNESIGFRPTATVTSVVLELP